MIQWKYIENICLIVGGRGDDRRLKIGPEQFTQSIDVKIDLNK